MFNSEFSNSQIHLSNYPSIIIFSQHYTFVPYFIYNIHTIYGFMLIFILHIHTHTMYFLSCFCLPICRMSCILKELLVPIFDNGVSWTIKICDLYLLCLLLYLLYSLFNLYC